MLRTYYSDSLHALLARLADGVAQQPFSLTTPATVIVPNANVAKWLKMQVARLNGVTMNIEFPYLERGLWNLTCQIASNETAYAQPTSAEQSRFALAARLVAQLERGPAKDPLTMFCLGAADRFSRRNPDQTRRVWQLSRDLSRLFREYEYHRGLSPLASAPPPRPGMATDRDLIGFWLYPDSDLLDVPNSLLPRSVKGARRKRLQQLFAAQGKLYCGAVQALSAGEPPELSLPSLARRVNWDAPAQQPADTVVHLFGISQLSPFHCWLLHRLGMHRELRLYHFNVCREFWEDVETPGELRRKIQRTKIKDDELDLSIENELLGAWGKCGRETVRLLGGVEEIGASDFQWLPNQQPASPTLLSQLQQSIAARTSAVAPLDKPDQTLELLACPSQRREVETIHNHIITSMMDDPTLKQTDIAVLVPNMDAYRSAFGAIFDARKSLDYNLVDSTAGSDSVLAKGMRDALGLAAGPFTRRRVLELLANPCVLERLKATPEDLETWAQWASTLGIFHHFDDAHRVADGLTASPRFTWQQGLRRLRLGRILDVDTDETLFPYHPPHADMHSSGRTLDTFSVWLTRLYQRIDSFGVPRPPEDWADELNRFVDDFLAVPAERPQEEQVLTSLRGALAALAGTAGTLGFADHLQAAGCTDTQLPLEWVRQYLTEQLDALPSGRGAYLTGGVTIASLLPMRPVPFRRIYILGLGEGEFPGQNTASTLDLRSCRRRIGDTSRADSGRYLFLETLMATRERLCLSYVCQDIKKDEEKQPCSLVLQLSAFLNSHVLEKAKDAWGPHPIPLNSYSAAYAELAGQPVPSPPQWHLPAQLLAYLGTGAASPDRLEHLQDQEPAVGPALQALCPPPENAPLQSGATVTADEALYVSLRELCTFIKDPPAAILRFRYGLRDDDNAEDMTEEDEPLESGFPASYSLPREALRVAFIQSDPSAGRSYIEQAVKKRATASLGPADEFLPFDTDRLSSTIATREAAANRPSTYCSLAGIGATISEPEPVPRRLELPGKTGTGTVVITARPSALLVSFPDAPDLIAALAPVERGRDSAPGVPGRVLGEFMELLHRVACEPDFPQTPREAVLYASFPSPKPVKQFALQISPQRARDYLGSLVHDLQTTSQLQLMPYDVIRVARKNGIPSPADLATQLVDRVDARGGYSLRGVVRLHRDELTVPDDLDTLIETRLELLLNTSEGKLQKPSSTGGGV